MWLLEYWTHLLWLGVTVRPSADWIARQLTEAYGCVVPFSMSEPTTHLGRIAILWRGDEAARRSATPETSRFRGVFAALADKTCPTRAGSHLPIL